MKDKGLYMIIAAVFFSPLALLFYIEWYWVFLIYNIFWAILSYGARSETKNPKISSRNAFLIPLVFNLIGFGYVAMKLNDDDDDEIVEPKSNDELEAAKSRLRENILGTSKIEKVEKNISMDVGKILGMNPNSDCRVSFSFTEEWKSCYYQNKTGSEFNLNTLPLLKEDYIQDTGEPLLNDNNDEVYDPSQEIQHQKYLEVNQKEVYSSKTVIGLLQEKIKGKLDSGELHQDSKQDEILLALEVYDTCPESIILFFKSLGCDDYKNLERKNEYDNLLWTSSTQLEDEYVVFSLDEINGYPNQEETNEISENNKSIEEENKIDGNTDEDEQWKKGVKVIEAEIISSIDVCWSSFKAQNTFLETLCDNKTMEDWYGFVKWSYTMDGEGAAKDYLNSDSEIEISKIMQSALNICDYIYEKDYVDHKELAYRVCGRLCEECDGKGFLNTKNEDCVECDGIGRLGYPDNDYGDEALEEAFNNIQSKVDYTSFKSLSKIIEKVDDKSTSVEKLIKIKIRDAIVNTSLNKLDEFKIDYKKVDNQDWQYISNSPTDGYLDDAINLEPDGQFVRVEEFNLMDDNGGQIGHVIRYILHNCDIPDRNNNLFYVNDSENCELLFFTRDDSDNGDVFLKESELRTKLIQSYNNMNTYKYEDDIYNFDNAPFLWINE